MSPPIIYSKKFIILRAWLIMILFIENIINRLSLYCYFASRLLLLLWGNIEVYNSVVNMYAPKRQEFDLLVMDARVKLAAIDFNANVNRKQDTVKVSRRGSANVGEKKSPDIKFTIISTPHANHLCRSVTCNSNRRRQSKLLFCLVYK